MRESIVSEINRVRVGVLSRIFVETALAAHLVVVSFYWWLSPKGFPLTHCRFWLNTAVPLAVMLCLLASLVAALRHQHNIPAISLAGCAAAWGALALTGRLLFPVSLERLWLAGVFPAVLLLVGGIAIFRVAQLRAMVWISAVIAGGAIGAFAVWAQVPARPSTRPASGVTSGLSEVDLSSHNLPLVRLGEGNNFHPAMAELSAKCGNANLHISPLLTFDRTTQDGFWSILAPLPGNDRKVSSCIVDQDGCRCAYTDGSTIRIDKPNIGGRVELKASTIVKQPTYSHLNSFCVVSITGHRDISLAFSPCKEIHIDVLPADYPTGRPARFAYLDADSTFRVVEASSGEKGPFRLLASGPMRDGAPLAMVVRDDGQQIATVVLEDWSSQLSTALSPTAGWGVPVNAIEFQRLGSSKDSEIQIWVTLAATSVGRGWECVGHRSGTYRNRISIRRNPPATGTKP